MNFYNLTSTEFSAAVIILNLFLSFALQLFIAWVYKRTHKGLSYSQGFIFTLIMVGVVATVVMMVVQNNIAGAFALLGAFSLIRFRTIMKETRDIAFVFFSLAIGVSVGTANYAIALIASVFISAAVLAMNRYNVGGISSGLGYLLTITSKGGFDLERMKEILDRRASSYEFLQSRNYEDGVSEQVFSVKFKRDIESGKMVGEIKENSNVTGVELMSTKHSTEY